MTRDYDFRATLSLTIDLLTAAVTTDRDRMYKRRFADWNLRENKKYVRSKPGSQARAKVPYLLQRAGDPPALRPPNPSFLLAPEYIRLPETVLQYSRLLVLTGLSEKYLLHRHVLAALYLQLMSNFFDDKVHTYKLSKGNISFLVVAFLIMLRLPEDLASCVLEFISRLVAIKLPSLHPIVRAWRTILEADRQCVWDNAFVFINNYFEVLQSAHGKSDPMLKKPAAIMCDPEMYFDHKRKGPGVVGTVEDERTVLPAVKRYLGEECEFLHHRLVVAHAHLVAADPVLARDIAAEVSAVCDAHHGTWHYDIINGRSLALQLRAAMHPSGGGGSPVSVGAWPRGTPSTRSTLRGRPWWAS
ncbi:hypothetical protein PG994_004857 [Apiospora phragmitis]|uniref:Uncharacterized protein n=1 Tax=Apiospora phragmitis TaxID=2905665 RepID=A0ABR1VRW4_9PEZI